MSTFISHIAWQDATQTRPAEDGVYLVETGYSIKDISIMNYSVEGGWNTFRDGDGVLHANNAIDNEDNYIHLWAFFPTVEEVRSEYETE